MYKRLLTIFVIAVFLITSVGVISAADNISVKVVWDGGDAADHVTVNLLKDGKVVDSAILSAENSWKTTFKVDDDGDYTVSESSSPDYSSKISGNQESGFIIKNHIVNGDVLKSSDDENLEESTDEKAVQNDDQSNEDASNDDGVTPGDDSTDDDVPAQDDSNSTDNSTDDNATDNSTEKDKSSQKDNDTEDVSNSDKNDKKETIVTKVTEITKKSKVIKKDDKKPENTTKTKTKNTNAGFPIVILVCAVFVAAFAPLVRKK